MAEPNGSGRYFDQSQYDFLKQCSEKGEEGIKEWNEWRRQNPLQDVLLEGAFLREWWLRGVNFGTLSPRPVPLTEGKKAGYAYLSGAQLQGARMEGASFELAHLEMASLHRAHLEGAYLQYAYLQRASLPETYLQGAIFDMAHLQQAHFAQAIVDGTTSFWRCYVATETDFNGVGLGSARIDPATRQLLEYNIRRMNWERWYKEHRWLKWGVKLFWWMSDYGLSTKWVVVTFFVLALAFGVVYYLAAVAYPPGIVSSLLKGDEGPVPTWLVPVRAFYFSVVTMTTLGFGDMHANCQSFWGHVLLTLQVLLGYVLLGALVTRFAVLFTAGGPAGRLVEHESEKAITERKAGESN